MPLPDERPRQSVANLIGRFENQVKRQPSSSPGSARSSSVVSHTTGDSAKEEAKEKREWPPKSVTPQERPPPIVPSSSWSRSQAAAVQPSTQPDQTSAATQADISEEDSSVTPRANSAISIDVGKVPQGQLSIGVTAPTPTSSNTPTTAKPLSKGPQVKPHAPRPSLPAVPKTPARTAPRASTHHPPIAQPLKPQHTGPAALPSVRKVTPKTVTAPTTPARSKTPSRPVSSAASRPKTPSSTRSKTPSSGLFAPTAASLARARSAQPLPPTPSKKATLSSTVAERLSKPTAASLSRARSPTAVPARGGAKASPARGGAAPRGAAKPRPSATTTRVKGNAAAAAKTSVAAAATAASAVNVGIVAVTDESLSQGNGHLDDDAVDSHDEALPDTSHSDVDTEAKENQAGHATEAAEIFVAKSPEPVAEPESDVPEEQQGTPSIDERRDEVKSRVPRDDIEDMVNLLESAPISKPRPDSIYSIPDEVSEIPDEE